MILDEDTLPLFNPQILLDRLDGNQELVHRIVGMFLDETPPTVEDLKKALIEENSSEAEHKAHALKGMCATLETKKLMQLAALIETAAKNKKLDEARALFEEVDSLWDATKKPLEIFLRDKSTQ